MIDCRYHIYIAFEYPTTGDGDHEDDVLVDQIDDALLDLPGRLPGADVQDMNVFGGNAACGPYLECWSSLMEDAVFAENEIIKLLLERGCTIGKETR